MARSLGSPLLTSDKCLNPTLAASGPTVKQCHILGQLRSQFLWNRSNRPYSSEFGVFKGFRSIMAPPAKPKVKVLTYSPFNMPVERVLMFVWCVFSIWIQLLKICNWLLSILHWLDFYGTVLNNKRLRAFKLTWVLAYVYRQPHKIK